MSISDFIMGIEDYEDVQRWKKMAKCFRPGDAAALSLFFMNEICPDQEEGRNCDLCGREAKDLCDLISRVHAAAEMADSKIGIEHHTAETDQMVPPNGKVWQITEERVGLMRYCLDSLLDAPDIEESPGPRHSIEMLRAMLKEAGQE